MLCARDYDNDEYVMPPHLILTTHFKENLCYYSYSTDRETRFREVK